MVLIVTRITTAQIELSVILYDFLILLPVIVRMAVHEAIGRSIDVLLLGELELCLLLLP